MGRVTLVSASSGARFGTAVRICTCTLEMSGTTSSGRRTAVQSPATKPEATRSTTAKRWRRTKRSKSEIMEARRRTTLRGQAAAAEKQKRLRGQRSAQPLLQARFVTGRRSNGRGGVEVRRGLSTSRRSVYLCLVPSGLIVPHLHACNCPWPSACRRARRWPRHRSGRPGRRRAGAARDTIGGQGVAERLAGLGAHDQVRLTDKRRDGSAGRWRHAR